MRGAVRYLIAREARHFVAAGLIALAGAIASPAAGEVEVHVPVVRATPGATVTIALDLDQSLAPLDVRSIEYTLDLDPAFVSSVTLLNDGVVWTWGAPFTNVTPTAVYLAAAGATKITSGSTRLHSLQLHVAPGAPVGGTMALTFSKLRFNEGTPQARPTLGLLEIRTTVDAPSPGPEMFALAPATPNPICGAALFRCRVPASDGAARLALYSVDGRRVRSLAVAAGGAERAVRWDARDEAGRLVPAGVYAARLECGGKAIVRRCVVVR